MSALPPSPDEPTVARPPEETPTVVVREDTPRAPLVLTPGTILGSRYRIVSSIGRGGMGEVYRADDLRIGHTVALKFLSRPEHASHLFEELRVGRDVTHPNVCRLYDVAEVDGRFFITMEFIDGENLASLLRRVGRLPPEKALAVARDICAGVAAAHEKGVIHRDLKPANVMIDGRGRARVTDFGLAIAGDAATDTSGTPAYMAPEQLAGAGATRASDVYALGLVLYEIFTGRRPFEASSAHALLMREKAGEFSRPSSVARDIPPVVEQIIVRCLEAEPAARPASVEEILRELPGGDPLAAAIAAGETPSPAMVAAAEKVGDLSPRIAWLLLVLAIGGFFATAILSERTLLSKLGDMQSPDVLAHRAREILGAAGMTARPRDDDLLTKIEPFTDELTIVYRQSPQAMLPRNAQGLLTTFDPPLHPGMATVELDAHGRLRRFLIAPPVIGTAAPTEPDWMPFVAAAGYERGLLQPADPTWAAAVVHGRRLSSYVDSDRKIAWTTRDGKRIEAASFRGRPVFFSVISDATMRVATAAPGGTTYWPEMIAEWMAVLFLAGLPIAAVMLASIHLRRRQGDLRGALRTAVVMFVAFFIALNARAHHPMTIAGERVLVGGLVLRALAWALIAGTMYIALEPVVRRRWPEMLIGWSRLIAGRFADPMVGRDVLLGAAGAAVTVLVWQSTLIVAGITAPLSPHNLGPARMVVYAVAGILGECVLRGIGLVVLLVVLRALIRHDVVASVTAIVLIALLTLGDTYGEPWVRAYYAISGSTLAVMLARHFGMLAAMSYAFFGLLQQRLPFTIDRGAWYFSRSMVVIAILCLVVAIAFRISVGTRRWLPRVAV